MTKRKDLFDLQKSRQCALMTQNEMAMEASLQRIHDSQALVRRASFLLRTNLNPQLLVLNDE
jgi:hypothetical protein